MFSFEQLLSTFMLKIPALVASYTARNCPEVSWKLSPAAVAGLTALSPVTPPPPPPPPDVTVRTYPCNVNRIWHVFLNCQRPRTQTNVNLSVVRSNESCQHLILTTEADWGCVWVHDLRATPTMFLKRMYTHTSLPAFFFFCWVFQRSVSVALPLKGQNSKWPEMTCEWGCE